MKSCSTSLTMESVDIIATSLKRTMGHLLTLEALAIKSLNLNLNTKDEYRSRTLTIKL